MKSMLLLAIFLVQLSMLAFGLAASMYAILGITKSSIVARMSKTVSLATPLLLGLYGILVSILVPYLLYFARRMGYATPITRNEGWNLVHTAWFLNGHPLYPPLTEFPVTPLNYPPLSFLILAPVSYFTRTPLLTGRCVALISLLALSFLIFRIIITFSESRIGAGLGALLWLTLMVRLADEYVGVYDPQMLGHLFSVGALYSYVKWRNGLTPQRLMIVAALCSFGLFTKHLLVTVPLAIAVTLYIEDRRKLPAFLLFGTLTLALMVLGTWLLVGNDFLANMSVELGRGLSVPLMLNKVRLLMAGRLAIVFLVALPILLLQRKRMFTFPAVYFVASLMVGALADLGRGVVINVWFDFFIAVSIIFGLLAKEIMLEESSWSRAFIPAILVVCLLPVYTEGSFRGGIHGLVPVKRDLGEALNYPWLQEQDRVYRLDVERLRSIPGPVLVDEPKLVFDAGKEYLFDTFLGMQLIISGRVPEHALTDRIRNQEFGTIALSFKLDDALNALNQSRTSASKTTRLTGMWTDNALTAVEEKYQLLGPSLSHFFFYVPRKRL